MMPSNVRLSAGRQVAGRGASCRRAAGKTARPTGPTLCLAGVVAASPPQHSLQRCGRPCASAAGLAASLPHSLTLPRKPTCVVEQSPPALWSSLRFLASPFFCSCGRSGFLVLARVVWPSCIKGWEGQGGSHARRARLNTPLGEQGVVCVRQADLPQLQQTPPIRTHVGCEALFPGQCRQCPGAVQVVHIRASKWDHCTNAPAAAAAGWRSLLCRPKPRLLTACIQLLAAHLPQAVHLRLLDLPLHQLSLQNIEDIQNMQVEIASWRQPLSAASK